MLCLHPGYGARARLNSHSYWLFCTVTPPKAVWPENTSDRKKDNVKEKQYNKLAYEHGQFIFVCGYIFFLLPKPNKSFNIHSLFFGK